MGIAVLCRWPQNMDSSGFPAYMELEGTPAELSDAWFELVTSDPER